MCQNTLLSDVLYKYATLVYITYSALCATPILINIMEEIRWLRLKSKI